MDGQGWAIIVAAVFLGLQQMLAMYLSYRREQAKIIRDDRVVAKLDDNTSLTTKSVNVVAAIKDDMVSQHMETKESIGAIHDSQQAIVKEMNGLHDAAMKEHGEVEHDRGVTEGRKNVEKHPHSGHGLTGFDVH